MIGKLLQVPILVSEWCDKTVGDYITGFEGNLILTTLAIKIITFI